METSGSWQPTLPPPRRRSGAWSSARRPTSPLQIEINDELASRVLVPVVGLGDRLVLRLDGREPFTQRFQFTLDLLAGLLRRIPLGLQGLQLFDAGGRGYQC